MWYGFVYGRTKDDRLERVRQKLIVIKQTWQEIVQFIFINNIGLKKINFAGYWQFTLFRSMVYSPLY